MTDRGTENGSSRSIEELQKVIEGLDEGVVAFDRDGNLLLANQAALRLLNAPANTRTLERLQEHLDAWQVRDSHGELVPRSERPVERAARGDTFDKTAYRYYDAKRNDERQLVCACRSMSDVPEVRVLTVHDVTAIREAREERDYARTEQELAEQQFQAVFDANPAPTFILDLRTNVIHAGNQGIPEVTGHRPGELQGKDILATHLFEDAELLEQVLTSLRNGHSVPKTAATLKRKSGERGYVLFAAKPIALKTGPGAVFTFVDVTEQREAELRFTKAFRLAPVPALMTTFEEDCVVDVNNSYLEEFERDKDSMIGRDLSELGFWASERDAYLARKALNKRGKYRALELRLRRDGSARTALGFADTLNLSGTKVVLQMFSDITERKKTEQHLVRAIQAVMSDTSWFTRSFLEQLAEVRKNEDGEATGAPYPDLTRRERQVLERLANGQGTKEISNELDISLNTVRNYLTSIYQKLGVSSRAEAMVWARERGIGSI